MDNENTQQTDDIRYMERALELAREAAAADEVPVGAVIVHRGEIIAEARNDREASRCATHHAELMAIEAACRKLGGWRLPDCTLYVTLEPCPMCAGACGSVVNLNDLPLNHKMQIEGGVCCESCREVLATYFRGKRKKKSDAPEGVENT